MLVIKIFLKGTFVSLSGNNLTPTTKINNDQTIQVMIAVKPEMAIAVLIIVLSLQTKLGDKVNVLIDRLLDYMDGNKENPNGKKKKNKSQTTQPQQVNSANNDNTTSINQLPTSNAIPPPQSLAQQTNTDFNAMFAQQNTPLVNASSPSSDGMAYENFGPMAANEALSGGFGGASW
jgi:hypothetical protein